MKSETHQVSEFDRVSLKAVGKVAITSGDNQSLVITAEEDVLDKLVTEVKDGELILSARPNTRFEGTPQLEYRITTPALKAVALGGAGTIGVAGLPNLAAASLDGSGGITVADLHTPQVIASIGGSGVITLAGDVDRQIVTISGSGSYRGEGLQSTDAQVTISGSGGALVNAEASLNVVISGSGSVRYLGDPKVSRVISGSGSISRRQADS